MAFGVGKETVFILVGNQVDALVCLIEDLLLLRRDRRVADGDRNAGKRGVFIALGLNLVEHFARLRGAVDLDALFNDLAELLFADQERNFKLKPVFGLRAVDEAEVLRDRAVEDDLADRRIHKAFTHLAVDFKAAADLDLRVHLDGLRVVGHDRFVDVLKDLALALLAVAVERQPVGAEHHVLRRHGHRLAFGRL